DDVRYGGAMRRLKYEYDATQLTITPHGAIRREINLDTNQIISEINIPDATNRNRRTETRGDGPTRNFTYTDPGTVSNEPGGQCDAMPQFLKNYTDFEGHTTYIGYDNVWYITSVTDARGSGAGDPNFTTTYEHIALGAVTKITHPDGRSIIQTYTDNAKPYYLSSRTDEESKITTFTRDPTFNRITRVD